MSVPTREPWDDMTTASASDEPHIIESFEVTCVIGTVHLGPNGSQSPYQAAFALIADNGGEGLFSFPLGGRIVHVDVNSTEQPKPKPARR